jgi:hypothetical protein
MARISLRQGAARRPGMSSLPHNGGEAADRRYVRYVPRLRSRPFRYWWRRCGAGLASARRLGSPLHESRTGSAIRLRSPRTVKGSSGFCASSQASPAAAKKLNNHRPANDTEVEDTAGLWGLTICCVPFSRRSNKCTSRNGRVGVRHLLGASRSRVDSSFRGGVVRSCGSGIKGECSWRKIS